MKKRLLVIVCILLVAYFLGIFAIPKTGVSIYMKEGDGPDQFTNASIYHTSPSKFLETIYAPIYSSAKFDESGNPNFIARYVFGIDFNIANPTPKADE